MLLKCIIIVSNLAFWGMTSSLTLQSIMVHLFVSMICLAGIYKCDTWKFYKETSRVSKVIGYIMAGVVVYFSLKHFFGVEKWIFGQDLEMKWILAAGMVSIMTIPFLIFVCTGALNYMIILCKTVWDSKFWGLFWHKIKFKNIFLGVINIVIAAGSALFLMTVVYMIPIDMIEKNVCISAEKIQNESTYPQISKFCTSQLDNWTDSIMLAEAVNEEEGSALNQALLVSRGMIEGRNPYESLIDHYTKDIEYDSYVQYSRYWHGYHVILKPLLTCMSYPQIRILNGIVEVILFMTMCVLLYRKKYVSYIAPWLLGYLMLMPIALFKSLQFSPCYYIYTIGSILLLLLTEQKRTQYIGMVFLNLGIFTAFFDFLTFPVLSFCIPASIYFALDSKRTIGKSVTDLLRSGISWCLGYIGMWSSKWILGTLITGTNVLENAREALVVRSSHLASNGTENLSAFECLVKNMDAFLFTPVIVIVAIWIVFSIKKYRTEQVLNYNTKMEILLPYILIGFIPIAWYLVTVNHSSIHYWFTNKTLLALFMPSVLGFIQLQTMKKKEGNL